jgi:hypothetical protein
MYYTTLMITVRCDEDTCQKRLSMETEIDGDNLNIAFTVRRMARERGWGTRKRGDEIQDACPNHKEAVGG